MRGPVRVRETEIRRGIRAAAAEGYRVARIEISSDGKASLDNLQWQASDGAASPPSPGCAVGIGAMPRSPMSAPAIPQQVVDFLQQGYEPAHVVGGPKVDDVEVGFQHSRKAARSGSGSSTRWFCGLAPMTRKFGRLQTGFGNDDLKKRAANPFGCSDPRVAFPGQRKGLNAMSNGSTCRAVQRCRI